MSQEIIGALKALKLHGMAANYPEVAAQARRNIDANGLAGRFSVVTGDLRKHRGILPASAFDAAGGTR